MSVVEVVHAVVVLVQLLRERGHENRTAVVVVVDVVVVVVVRAADHAARHEDQVPVVEPRVQRLRAAADGACRNL